MPNQETVSVSAGGYQFPVNVATSKLLYISDKAPRTSSNRATITITINRDGSVDTTRLPPDEPSTITPQLPVQKPDNVAFVPHLGYFPSYTQCSPEQRWVYLNWLGDVSSPIHISYVFTYYYGLERRLLYDEYDLAFGEIHRLRNHHHHPSFVRYSTSALLQASLLKNRYDMLHHIFYPASWREQENKSLLVAYAIGANISPAGLVSVGQYISGVNKRYIQAEPELFESVLSRVLGDRYGKPVFPLREKYEFKDLPKRREFVFANTSFFHEMRTANQPDFYSYAPFVDEVMDLFAQTHESVKVLLKQQRGQ